MLVYINEAQLRVYNIGESFVCEKALETYDDPVKENPWTNDDFFEFKARRGWFEKFKNRSKIHNVIRHGEPASLNKEAAEKFVKFNDVIRKKAISPAGI